MNDGIAIILKRMDTHPEEFYGEEKKWAFMYKEYFRDVMSESEKAAIHEKLKAIRKAELTQKVMHALMAEPEMEYRWESEKSAFAPAPVKREGSAVNYDKGTGMVIVNAGGKTTVFK